MGMVKQNPEFKEGNLKKQRKISAVGMYCKHPPCVYRLAWFVSVCCCFFSLSCARLPGHREGALVRHLHHGLRVTDVGARNAMILLLYRDTRAHCHKAEHEHRTSQRLIPTTSYKGLHIQTHARTHARTHTHTHAHTHTQPCQWYQYCNK